MPNKTNQLPKDRKVKAPPPRRSRPPLYLAGGALLVIIAGVVCWPRAGVDHPALAVLRRFRPAGARGRSREDRLRQGAARCAREGHLPAQQRR